MDIQVAKIEELKEGGALLHIDMDEEAVYTLQKEADEKNCTIEDILLKALEEGIENVDKSGVREQQ